MALWTVRCFRSGSGRQLFLEEFREQSFEARAEFRSIVTGLKHQPEITGWAREMGFDRLTGKKYRQFRGLAKLIFKANGVQHRPLGFFGPNVREFTFLIWATERGGSFHPPNVLDTALRRMTDVTANPEQADDSDF
jgi:hypothetical protein